MLRVRLIKRHLDWDEVLASIPKAPADIKEKLYNTILADRVLHKMSKGIDKDQRFAPDTVMLCELLSQVLERQTSFIYKPFVIRGMLNRSHLVKWNMVINTLEFKGTPTSMTHNARQLLYRKALTLLVKDIQRIRLRAAPLTVLNHLHRIPAIYDNAFPNYIHSGLTSATVGLPLS